MMLKKPLAVLILLISWFPAVVNAESSVKVFQTQQPAQALIPSIAPLYGQQAQFTAKDNDLVVKAPEAIIREIEQLLKELDKPLQNLLIEVASSLDGSDNFQQDSIEGRIKVGSDAEIRSRAPQSSSPNTTIRYREDGTVIKSTHTRRNRFGQNPETFKLRTVEGNWAYIQVGQRVPYYTSDYPVPPRADRRFGPWQHSVQLEDVTSGFDVLPIINGEQITLKVRPHNSAMNRQYPDRINTRVIDTVVTGKIDQWIYLGGAISELNKKNSGFIHSSKRFSELDSNYRIKVTIID